MNHAELALDNLLDQDWIQDDLANSTISRTTDGEIIVWLEKEIYRITQGGRVYRIPAPEFAEVLI